MKKFLRKHTNTLLVFFALVFFALIVAYFVWGVSDIVFEVNKANHSQITNQPVPGFDLQGAAGLDYKGMLPATSS